jgi:hypothetical protein
MPVEAQTVEYSYLGDGVSTVFQFPSRFLSNDDLFVALNGVVQVAGFTITGAGTDDGGEVTFAVAPGNLVRVMIVRNPSPSQLIDFENGQTVLEGTLDNALDKLTMIAQYLLRSARRSVRIGDAIYTTEGSGLLELPAASARVAKLFAFDNNGKVELIDRAAFEQAMADAVAAAATAVAAANAASASEGSAESSALAAAQALSDIQLLLNGVSSATRREYTMTAGQTVIPVGPFTTNALFVYYDGVLLDPLTEYTLASPIITLTEGAADQAHIDVIEFKAVNITNALIAGNDLADVSNKKNGRQNLEITKIMTGPNANSAISADTRVVHIGTAFTAARVYTLPAANAVNPGEAIEVFDTVLGVSATNTLTIQRAGTDTINGATSATLANAGAAIRLVSDGVSKWAYQVIGQDALPGCCRLVLNGSNLELRRLNGRLLWIGTKAEVIPATPPSLAPTGLTVSTLYYVYAYMNSGVMALEASITGPTTDTSYGHRVKTGDTSRSLVGMVYPVTGPAFADTPAQRLVVSWFNRVPTYGAARFSAIRTTTSTTYVELNAEIRVQFLAWADTAVSFAVNGGAYNSGANQTLTSIGVDGATPQDVAGLGSGANSQSVSINHPVILAEGFHYATVLGRVSAGTGNWYTNTDNPGERFTLKAIIQG